MDKNANNLSSKGLRTHLHASNGPQTLNISIQAATLFMLPLTPHTI